MTETLCTVPGCDRPVQDAHVCGACAGQLEDALRHVTGHQGRDAWCHGIGVDLDIALMRLSRLGAAGGRRGGAPLLFDPRASAARAALRSTLEGWVRAAQGVPGTHAAAQRAPGDTLPALGGWLLDRVEGLRHHPDGGQAVADITGAVRYALHIVDRPADRWYAGMCGADTRPEDPAGGWCDTDLYAPVGAAVLQCPACGSTWDVKARRNWLLSQAEDVLAYAALIAQALSALGTPVTPVMITRWVSAGRLLDHGHDSTGRRLYRLGDVITLAADHAARQASRDNRRQAKAS